MSGDKVVKLREERQLLARFMVIQQTQKLDISSAIGAFEMAVIPRSLFANDGTLLTPTSKSSIIHAIEVVPNIYEAVSRDDPPEEEVVSQNQSLIDESWIENNYPRDYDVEKVLIIDAMAVLQGMKKTPQMKKISDLRVAFSRRIQYLAEDYNETRLIFDEYTRNSLKQKTRAKRATCAQAASMEYHVHGNMSLTSLKELLSST